MDEPIVYRILRVKDISFSVNEVMFNPNYDVTKMQVRVNCELKYNAEANYLILEMNAFFLYEYPDREDIFADIVVHNVFEIANIKEFIQDTKVILPERLLVTLMGISLSHTRALFSKNIAGTAFNLLILPLIDPLEFSRQIFPYMFGIKDEPITAVAATA